MDFYNDKSKDDFIDLFKKYGGSSKKKKKKTRRIQKRKVIREIRILKIN